MQDTTVRSARLTKLDASVLKTEVAAYERMCEGIDSPRALACYLLARAGEFNQLIQLETDPNNYDSVTEFRDDYLVSEALKKNPRLPLGIDRKAVALDKFLQAEKACADTNLRFRKIPHGELPPGDNRVLSLLKRARRIIHQTLGRVTPADLRFVESKMKFGPGATTAVRGAHVAYSTKYACLQATPRLIPFVPSFVPPLWAEAAGGEIKPATASKVTTVPKNAKTDRTICIEPHLNIVVQLGTGKLIRKRLRAVGVDLRTQELNQTLAQHAQSLSLATIDLSSASDMIAMSIVQYFLPVDWLALLNLSRTDHTELPDGTIIRLQKWSSMGNGYTFELETLIFWALARACSSNPLLTTSYGDDIILPQKDAPTLIELLEFCGFKVNREKTCLAGTFFESCGSDWFMGVNVRPIYFRSEIENHMDAHDAFFLYANQIRRYARGYYDINTHSTGLKQPGCDSRLLPAWLRIFGAIPKKLRVRIPDGVGDGGLISNQDEAAPRWCRHTFAFEFSMRIRLPVFRSPKYALAHLVSLLHRAPLLPVDDRKHHSYPALFSNADRSSPFRSSSKRNLPESPYFKEAMIRNKGKPQHTRATCYTWPDLGPWR